MKCRLPFDFRLVRCRALPDCVEALTALQAHLEAVYNEAHANEVAPREAEWSDEDEEAMACGYSFARRRQRERPDAEYAQEDELDPAVTTWLYGPTAGRRLKGDRRSWQERRIGYQVGGCGYGSHHLRCSCVQWERALPMPACLSVIHGHDPPHMRCCSMRSSSWRRRSSTASKRRTRQPGGPG